MIHHQSIHSEGKPCKCDRCKGLGSHIRPDQSSKNTHRREPLHVYHVQATLCSEITPDSPAQNTLWRQVSAQYLLVIRSFTPWRKRVNSLNVSSPQCELASGTTPISPKGKFFTQEEDTPGKNRAKAGKPFTVACYTSQSSYWRELCGRGECQESIYLELIPLQSDNSLRM